MVNKPTVHVRPSLTLSRHFLLFIGLGLKFHDYRLTPGPIGPQALQENADLK